MAPKAELILDHVDLGAATGVAGYLSTPAFDQPSLHKSAEGKQVAPQGMNWRSSAPDNRPESALRTYRLSR